MPDAGRVVAGTAKGTRLDAPGDGTRPLGDRVKQTLFAILDAEWPQGWPGPFLDLFAGSGAAGIEALSRGALGCLFVERDARAAGVIEQNLRRAGLLSSSGDDARVRVLKADVGRLLEGAVMAPGPFAGVLVDPPYADVGPEGVLQRLGDPSAGWLAPRAVVVAKHFWRATLPEALGVLERWRERRFGETMLTFYRSVGPQGEGE